VRCAITLVKSIQNYSPRACDCDFCTKRNIHYLSGEGAEITITSQQPLSRLQQGSKQAEFLTCLNCNTVIAVAIAVEAQLIGAINSTILKDANRLLVSTSASPKQLNATEKYAGWRQI
jgi:hypothetical protein